MLVDRFDSEVGDGGVNLPIMELMRADWATRVGDVKTGLGGSEFNSMIICSAFVISDEILLNESFNSVMEKAGIIRRMVKKLYFKLISDFYEYFIKRCLWSFNINSLLMYTFSNAAISSKSFQKSSWVFN